MSFGVDESLTNVGDKIDGIFKQLEFSTLH
jgi:hypothetical protein